MLVYYGGWPLRLLVDLFSVSFLCFVLRPVLRWATVTNGAIFESCVWLSFSITSNEPVLSYNILFLGESNIGLIYSDKDKKNVGKSLTQELLAKLQGVPFRQHPLIVSGGNQTTTGTSELVFIINPKNIN